MILLGRRLPLVALRARFLVLERAIGLVSSLSGPAYMSCCPLPSDPSQAGIVREEEIAARGSFEGQYVDRPAKGKENMVWGKKQSEE